MRINHKIRGVKAHLRRIQHWFRLAPSLVRSHSNMIVEQYASHHSFVHGIPFWGRAHTKKGQAAHLPGYYATY
ncbi:hypothetical protein AH06_220 [Erwinia phage AH06]|nr:hypothetical protein AH06_220 [Erwinia phage AH06]